MNSLDTVLPVVFLAVMGLAMLAYVVLDGYDLGVGMLLPRASTEEKNTMVASIGPFWDANETWLVLGVGILLIAFPSAHGRILGALYLPVALMLIGLILRGVAFDFRVKARDQHQPLWNRIFFAGSMLASLAQGYMLGRYITGFAPGWGFTAFAVAIALTLPAAYVLMGAAWLILKTDGPLQLKAIGWARQAWWPMVGGIALISLATPFASPTVFARWFTMPELIALLPIPLISAGLLLWLRWLLVQTDQRRSGLTGRFCWAPLAIVVAVFVLAFLGLAYSLYPYVIIDQLTVWQAASSTPSLIVIGIGAAISVPAIVLYTIFSYRVFGGKVRELKYA
jgi:cytochrome bd ubiquinol oxidase subunit II